MVKTNAFVAVALIACNGGSPAKEDAPVVDFDRKALVTHLADNVYLPVYQKFATDSAALVTATEAMCTALGGTGEATARTAAQTAWRTAIDAWQAADELLIGPAAMDSKTLRDRIYSWPALQSSCGVDQEVMVRWGNPGGYDVAARLNNRRGLVAIEYLMFTATLAHSCPSQAAPVGWDGLSDADKHAARCGLAAAFAADVAGQAVVLHTAWRADGGNYRGQLVEAGTAASTVPSLHEALNRITDGFFYVDRIVKDMKLGESAGIAVNSCATVQQPCLAEVEHRHADHGKQAILVDLRTLKTAFTGTAAVDGPGFDDFLIAVNAPELATQMIGALDASIAATEALDGTLINALANDYANVVAAHATIKTFTDDLKSQFLTVLSLDIPDEVAHDND